MKIDGTFVIFQLDGEPILVEKVPLTWERAAREALLADLDGDKSAPVAKKLERAALAERLYGEMLPVEITASEAQMILERVSKVWSGAMVPYRMDSAITHAKALELGAKNAAKAKKAE